MNYAPLIEKKRARLAELEGAIASPDFFSDPKRAGDLTREHAQIRKLLESWEAWEATGRELEGSIELTKGEDAEMAAMAQEEIPALEKRLAKLSEEIQYSLLPRDANEDKDAIIEIRAGTGGDEAGLFAADLMRMYQRYAEARGWKVEPMEASTTDAGGFREVIFKISGSEVFRAMKYESGVHRVQRVPATETQGHRGAGWFPIPGDGERPP